MDEQPTVTIEFMHGPSDGATFRVPREQFRRGQPIEMRRCYHIYRSVVAWNGVADWIKLYDRGHVPAGVP